MIIVSITGPGMQEALGQISASAGYADVFEMRLDRIQNLEISRLMAATNSPIIATCRPVWEGGGYGGSEQERVNLLVNASILGAAFIDLELNAARSIREEFLRRRGESQMIVSHHVRDGEAVHVGPLYRKLRNTGADVVKLAFPAVDAYENAKAFEFLALAKADRQPAIGIAIGECGEPSRILYKKFGGWATYASPEDGPSAAPGQIPASVMKKVYRTHALTPKTKLYGVVGSPLGQSKGVFVHNEMFRRAGVDAVYCKFPTSNLSLFMRYVAPMLRGFSVTIPHKQEIREYLDRTDPAASKIGAVNTVIRRARALIGTNTDAAAALDAIETAGRVRGKRMLVVGAGGAARAIAFEAKRRGAEVAVTGRTPEVVEKLAREFRIEVIPMEQIRSAKFDILANATPVGMTPDVDASPVPSDILRGKIVFDAVYNPPITKLLSEASAAGATIVSGVEMYLNQAARQSALFSGKRPDRTVMKRILMSHLEAAGDGAGLNHLSGSNSIPLWTR